MPACYNTLHDIDTTKQPRGCGGQQGWNVRGKPPERVGGAVRLTGDCAADAWGDEPQAAAAYRPNVIPHTSLSALWWSRQSTRLAPLYVQSKSQSLGCDHRLKNTRKTAAARPHKPPPANRTTIHEFDTLQNLTKGPSAARCRHAAECDLFWQRRLLSIYRSIFGGSRPAHEWWTDG
jgi:hypothetical protein